MKTDEDVQIQERHRSREIIEEYGTDVPLLADSAPWNSKRFRKES